LKLEQHRKHTHTNRSVATAHSTVAVDRVAGRCVVVSPINNATTKSSESSSSSTSNDDDGDDSIAFITLNDNNNSSSSSSSSSRKLAAAAAVILESRKRPTQRTTNEQRTNNEHRQPTNDNQFVNLPTPQLANNERTHERTNSVELRSFVRLLSAVSQCE